jgi:hypothetical protein
MQFVPISHTNMGTFPPATSRTGPYLCTLEYYIRPGDALELLLIGFVSYVANHGVPEPEHTIFIFVANNFMHDCLMVALRSACQYVCQS